MYSTAAHRSVAGASIIPSHPIPSHQSLPLAVVSPLSVRDSLAPHLPVSNPHGPRPFPSRTRARSLSGTWQSPRQSLQPRDESHPGPCLRALGKMTCVPEAEIRGTRAHAAWPPLAETPAEPCISGVSMSGTTSSDAGVALEKMWTMCGRFVDDSWTHGWASGGLQQLSIRSYNVIFSVYIRCQPTASHAPRRRCA